MEAIVLAGGLGTRLKDIICDIPKPMAPVRRIPFLKYLLDYLENEKIRKVIMSVGYKSEKIQDYFDYNHFQLDLKYSKENRPLGTGGAIRQALLLCRDEQVFILNGDSFFDVPLERLLEKHITHRADLSIALKPMKYFERYGNVLIDGSRVKGFHEKQKVNFGLINGGIYVVDREKLLNMELPVKFSFEIDYIEKYVETLYFAGFPFDNYFIDIGIPEDYIRAQKEIPKYINGKGNKYHEQSSFFRS